jgi:hypothetical protein
MLSFGGEGEDEEGEEAEEEEAEEAEEEEGEGAGAAAGADADGGEGEEGEEPPAPAPASLSLGEARRILSAAFEKPTLRSLARALQAFRAACYMGETAEMQSVLGLDDKGGGGGGGGGGGRGAPGKKNKKDRDGRELSARMAEEAPAARPLRYRIHSPKVFMLLVTTVMRCAPGALLALAWGSGKASAAPSSSAAKALATAPAWARASPLARSLLTCVQHLLATARDPRLLVFLLRALAPHVPLLQAFPVLTRKCLKTLTGLWAAPPAASNGVRLVAFLRLRQMAATLPYPTIDAVLKAVYLAYARACRAGLSEGSAVRVALLARANARYTAFSTPSMVG